MAYKPGAVVYYDDHRRIVLDGPFRTLDYPGVDQYEVKDIYGSKSFAWASDLITEEEYFESKGEEGCRE
jgi:hypothetical protein